MPSRRIMRMAGMARINHFAAASALVAAFSMAAAPALARNHHWHRWHGHDRIGVGDVLAGAVILGGIAAIANAASKHDSEEPGPPPPEDRQSYAYDEPRRDVGLDHAAGMCVDAVERGHDRVHAVDNVSRERDGWTVSGRLENGSGFACGVGSDGRIDDVDVAGLRSESVPPRGGQGADEGYSPSRKAQRQSNEQDDPSAAVDDNRPIWREAAPQPQPQDGGPEHQQDDGRYDTSSAPDFGQSV
jgi:hypothetical protein